MIYFIRILIVVYMYAVFTLASCEAQGNYSGVLYICFFCICDFGSKKFNKHGLFILKSDLTQALSMQANWPFELCYLAYQRSLATQQLIACILLAQFAYVVTVSICQFTVQAVHAFKACKKRKLQHFTLSNFCIYVHTMFTLEFGPSDSLLRL